MYVCTAIFVCSFDILHFPGHICTRTAKLVEQYFDKKNKKSRYCDRFDLNECNAPEWIKFEILPFFPLYFDLTFTLANRAKGRWKIMLSNYTKYYLKCGILHCIEFTSEIRSKVTISPFQLVEHWSKTSAKLNLYMYSLMSKERRKNQEAQIKVCWSVWIRWYDIF